MSGWFLLKGEKPTFPGLGLGDSENPGKGRRALGRDVTGTMGGDPARTCTLTLGLLCLRTFFSLLEPDLGVARRVVASAAWFQTHCFDPGGGQFLTPIPPSLGRMPAGLALPPCSPWTNQLWAGLQNDYVLKGQVARSHMLRGVESRRRKGCAYLPWGAGMLMGMDDIHCSQKPSRLPFAREHSCVPNSPAGKEKLSRVCSSAFSLLTTHASVAFN